VRSGDSELSRRASSQASPRPSAPQAWPAGLGPAATLRERQPRVRIRSRRGGRAHGERGALRVRLPPRWDPSATGEPLHPPPRAEPRVAAARPGAPWTARSIRALQDREPGPAWTRARRWLYRPPGLASALGTARGSPHPTVRTYSWNSSSSPRSPRAPRTRRSRSRACRPDRCDPAKAARSVGPRTKTRPSAGSSACAGSPTSTRIGPSCARRSPTPSRRASRPASSGIRSARTCGRSRPGARSTRPRTCRP